MPSSAAVRAVVTKDRWRPGVRNGIRLSDSRPRPCLSNAQLALREAAVKSDLIECVLGLGVQSWLDAQPATFRNTVQVVAMDASCVNHGMSARSRPIPDRDSGLIGAISR